MIDDDDYDDSMRTLSIVACAKYTDSSDKMHSASTTNATTDYLFSNKDARTILRREV